MTTNKVKLSDSHDLCLTSTARRNILAFIRSARTNYIENQLLNGADAPSVSQINPHVQRLQPSHQLILSLFFAYHLEIAEIAELLEVHRRQICDTLQDNLINNMQIES